MRVFVGATVLFTCLVVTIAAQAQQGPPPPQGGRPGGPAQAPKNLQVLPKDWTTQQVSSFMRTFTTGLGVQCTYCHVGTQQDRALDDKKEKLTARKMIAMTLAINDQYLKDVGEPAPALRPSPPRPRPPAHRHGSGRPRPAGRRGLAEGHVLHPATRCTTKPLTVAPVGGGGH